MVNIFIDIVRSSVGGKHINIGGGGIKTNENKIYCMSWSILHPILQI